MEHRRQRLGLLAFAFDAPGREILEALARRTDLRSALVFCHHAAGGAGSSAAPWLRQAPGSGWEEPAWALRIEQLSDGFEAAVQDALDARRWRTEKGGVDLVLLAPASPAGEVTLPAGTLAALGSIRHHYQNVSRIVLTAERSFATVGRARVKGKVSPLPFSDGSDDGLFDLVLLFDRENLKGWYLKDDAEATEHAAAAIAHLTAGELCTTIYQRLQAERARLGAAGRYFTLGVAEWRLEKEKLEAATGDLLVGGSAARLAGEAQVEIAGAAAPRGTGARQGDAEEWLPDDPWLREAPAAIDEIEPAAASEHVEALRDRATASLTGLFTENGCALGVLRRLLSRRRKELEELRRGKAAELATFMPRFARWYSEKRAGKEHAGTGVAQVEYQEEVLDRKKLVVFLGVLALALGSWYAAYKSGYPLELNVVLGIMAAAAVLLLFMGFNKVVTKTREVPVAPPPNLLDELREKRARLAAAADVLDWNEKLGTRLDNSLEDLRRLAAEKTPETEAPFPYSTEVCAALLAHRSLTVDAWLERFWHDRGQAVVVGLDGGGASLAAELREHAEESCRRSVSDVGWAQVLEALGGADSLSKPLWRQALEQARDAAVPRMRVPGETSYNFLALPRTLPEPMKDALSRHFPEQKIQEEIDGEAVLVVRVTQGYSP